MKRWIVILAVIVLSLGMAGQALAVNATEAINPEAQPTLGYGKAGDGIQKMLASPRTAYVKAGSGVVYTGSCRVIRVSMYAPTAGDAVSVYNSGVEDIYQGGINTFEFELSISANTSNAHWDAGGITFTNGVYLHATDTDVITNVIFDY